MQAAIITSKGLGDGLIMLVAASHLKRLGYTVDIFNPHLQELEKWLPDYKLKKTPDFFDLKELKNYNKIFCQYSNTEQIKKLSQKRKELKHFAFIYPSFNPQKSGNLKQDEFVCFSNRPLVESLQLMGKKIFKLKNPGKQLDLKIPKHLIFQKHTKRILIHPTSTCPIRTWHKKKFLKFAEKLKKQNFEVAFIMSLSERKDWLEVLTKGFLLPKLQTLNDLASYIYESAILIGNDSGPVHLASLLNLPNMIITNDPKRLKLWQPGWRKAVLVFPPKWVPNFKFLRLKINYWQNFTSVSRILRVFQKLTDKKKQPLITHLPRN